MMLTSSIKPMLTMRPNSYKENKTPWELAKEKQKDLSKKIAMIPPVFIEDLMEKDLENLAQGGHDVSSVPFLYINLNPSKYIC